MAHCCANQVKRLTSNPGISDRPRNDTAQDLPSPIERLKPTPSVMCQNLEHFVRIDVVFDVTTHEKGQ